MKLPIGNLMIKPGTPETVEKFRQAWPTAVSYSPFCPVCQHPAVNKGSHNIRICSECQTEFLKQLEDEKDNRSAG